MKDYYHPNKSRVKDWALNDFLRNPISGNLQEVPGIGSLSVKILGNAGISTTFQLIGKYLVLKEDGCGPFEHADRFYFWLKHVGITQHTASIVHCIGEKNEY